MAGIGRNFPLAALMLVILAVAAATLPSAMWVCGVAAVLGLAGVVAFRGNGWRSGALAAAAVALSLALLDAFAGLLSPGAMGQGLVRTIEPRHWPPPNPVLGFRPLPDSSAVATATYGGELIYRRTYNFDSEAARVTPAAPAGADTYLFVGDSFTFGQGLADDETLASQFARSAGLKVRGVNLGVPGYGPNHLVRMIEAGLLDLYQPRPVKAVVTWIIPAQLARVTGEGSWLGTSPRYALEGGTLRYTGTFNEYRWTHPLAGLRYLLGQQFAFVDAIGRQQRQVEQVELFVALMQRLHEDVRAKFGVPLYVVYSWPDETSGTGYAQQGIAQPMLIDVLARLRKAGMILVAVDQLTGKYDVSQLLIPHDGHPNAFTNQLIAADLARRLIK
ncbi:MAG: hypothetical protein ACOY4R_30590 [Pseudomonadota bacterium]